MIHLLQKAPVPASKTPKTMETETTPPEVAAAAYAPEVATEETAQRSLGKTRKDFWVQTIVVSEDGTDTSMICYLYLTKGHGSSVDKAEEMLDNIFEGTRKQIMKAYHEEPHFPDSGEPDHGKTPTYSPAGFEKGWKLVTKEYLRRWFRL